MTKTKPDATQTPNRDCDPPEPMWKIFAIGDGWVCDPNKWVITRGNGVVCIADEDGKVIDDPPDTGQSDAAAVRWGIIWLIMNGGENGENLDACLEGLGTS